jgi:hypothetical protein
VRPNQRHVEFTAQRGVLVRRVTRAGGREYIQRATRDVLEVVCHAIEACGDDGATTNGLWVLLPQLPCTQISVALDFLKERGCIVVRCRRNYPASDFLVEDALVEFYALDLAREKRRPIWTAKC